MIIVGTSFLHNAHPQRGEERVTRYDSAAMLSSQNRPEKENIIYYNIDECNM